MPLDNLQHSVKSGGLADQALVSLSRDASRKPRGGAAGAPTPRHGNTGGSLRQSQQTHGESADPQQSGTDLLPQTTPPPKRASRAKKTSPEIADFLDEWFYDWLAVTIPNGTNGKGSKADGPRGDQESAEASDRMFLWATLAGLRVMRVGKGSDGYDGASHLAFDPTATSRVATVRDGHSTNMPSIELTGADGACARLAPRALAELGPVLISRVDVSCDVSQAGLWDALDVICCEMARDRDMTPPRYEGTEGKGRTLYFGKGEVSVRIYEKDLERVAKGALSAGDADPNKVRVEVTFRPKKGKKSGLARIARDEGPGALLGTVNWVRTLVQRIAIMTERAREDAATMAVTRVTTPPDPRPIRAKAAHGASQYAGTFCRAAIAQIVEDDFGGDWLAAEIAPEDVVESAVAAVRNYIQAAVGATAEDLGVLEVRTHEEEAARAKDMLDVWLREQREAVEAAQFALRRAAERAYEMCGVTA